MLLFSHNDFVMPGLVTHEALLCRGYILLDKESEVKVGFRERLHASEQSAHGTPKNDHNPFV